MDLLSKLETTAKDSGVLLSVHVIETKSISRKIVDFAASKKVNLIVIGSHGQTGFNRFLLGQCQQCNNPVSQMPCLDNKINIQF
jgi:nucleotide-binding universal stress UspA family protein